MTNRKSKIENGKSKMKNRKWNVENGNQKSKMEIKNGNQKWTVADFGMARAVDEELYEQETRQGVGPIKWMAPEQMERRVYSAKSDVFAFGALLFEIFVCAVPWQRVSNLVAAKRVMSKKCAPIPDNAKVPDAVRNLIAECWTHRASKRPTMEHVQQALSELVNSADAAAAGGDAAFEASLSSTSDSNSSWTKLNWCTRTTLSEF